MTCKLICLWKGTAGKCAEGLFSDSPFYLPLRSVYYMDKDTPITELKGIGEKTRQLFAKLNIQTVGSLL